MDKIIINGILSELVKTAEIPVNKDNIKDESVNTLKNLVAGAGAGVVAGFVANPVSQIANMKASHPQEYGTKSFMQVAKDLYKGRGAAAQKAAESGKPVIKGIRAFYPGFASQSMKNAIFSAAMFGSLPLMNKILDVRKNDPKTNE